MFKEIPELEINNDDSKQYHMIFEGDNLKALSHLEHLYMQKIDLIYIDPPYNTGNDFIYNDKMDREKWLDMMKIRLCLAKFLMHNDSVILISIDDKEHAHLKLLCDKIFGEENGFSFIWKKKDSPGNTEKILSNVTEYILGYFKEKKPGILNTREIERDFNRIDDKGPFRLQTIEKTNAGEYYRPTMCFPIKDLDTGKVWIPRKGQRWVYGEEKLSELAEKRKLCFDYQNKRVYEIKREEDFKDSAIPYTNLLLDCGSLKTAKDEIETLLGRREIFETPKPTKLILKLLEICGKKDSIVLDFFGGTGTTGHAVMLANKNDGGSRQFILCEQPPICEDILYPRIKAAIKGKEQKFGLAKKIGTKSLFVVRNSLKGNVKYFRYVGK